MNTFDLDEIQYPVLEVNGISSTSPLPSRKKDLSKNEDLVSFEDVYDPEYEDSIPTSDIVYDIGRGFILDRAECEENNLY